MSANVICGKKNIETREVMKKEENVKKGKKRKLISKGQNKCIRNKVKKGA
jgi:hypothetical protein